MEKMNLPLQQFLTLVGPAQALEIIEEDDTEPVFTGKAAKIRDHEELLTREVKHIQTGTKRRYEQGKKPFEPILKIWIY